MLSALAIVSSCVLHAEVTFTSQAYFNYDLHISSWPETSERVMICLHGYGDNYKIASSLKHLKSIEATLVSFNFPEYDIKEGREYVLPSNALGILFTKNNSITTNDSNRKSGLRMNKQSSLHAQNQAIEVRKDVVELILAEVVKIHIHNDILNSNGHVDIQKLNPLARLTGISYARVDSFCDISRGL